MKTETYHLELITPCFCAGADQTRAEIRAPSIRGQLRWWFRALGGTRDEEASLFGAMAGDTGKSSALIVRVSDLKRGNSWNPPKLNPNDSNTYVYHYASVSADKRRWTSGGNIPPGTTFTLSLIWRRNIIDSMLLKKFEVARDCFLRFGGVGLRVTRGLGAFACHEYRETPEQLADAARLVEKQGFVFRLSDQRYSNFETVISAAGAWLKNVLRKECKAKANSPLGLSSPRQTSAVYLRPVKFNNNEYGLLIFEAPHQRVLGRASQRPTPLITNREFKGPPPEGQSFRPKYR